MTNINLRYVVHLLGILLLLLSASMLTALGWSVYEYAANQSPWRAGLEVVWAFVYSIGIGVLLGGTLYLVGGKQKHAKLGGREALLLVSSAWFVGAIVGALPFYLWAVQHNFLPGQDTGFLNPINCFFESMSGLTTTGSTILTQIETIPNGILYWRSFTHWLGGLGIVVIFVAVLPMVGGGRKRLFRLEASGIGHDGVTPHIQETARVLLIIFSGLTLLQIIALKYFAPQMSWFEAITHSYSTLATGGFSTSNASAGHYGPAVQWIIVFFMLLAGINFGLYHRLWKGQFGLFFKNSELRAYVTICFIAFLVIAYFISGVPYHDTAGELVSSDVGQTLRDSAFQTLAIQTTTGFATANFEEWPLIPKAILLGLMFIGGCGGSTAGGIKVIRIVSAIKIMYLELERAFRPSVIRPVKIGGHTIEFHQRISVLAYVLGIFVLFAAGAVALMLTEDPGFIDGTTALTASIACVNNIGPGLAKVGAIENYSAFSSLGKLILCILMAIGRLEVFAVLVIFMPRFWRTD